MTLVPYQVHDVSGLAGDRVESLGTKEKFWLFPPSELGLPSIICLFKIGRPDTGENWSEKVCCEILRYLEVPCASYEFAVCDGVPGVLSRQFLTINGQFVPANMILESVIKDYDGRLKFRQRKYQVSSCLNLFKIKAVALPRGTSDRYKHLNAADVFVGYLVFDALVGNTDRHAENWGVVIDYTNRYDPTYSLAPAFDHASSLGRNEPNESRRRRLDTKDKRDTVASYCSRARSAFFGTGNKALLHTDVLDELIRYDQRAVNFWASVFSQIPENVFEDIFTRIDPRLMSDEAKRFALEMLRINVGTIKRYA